MTVKQGNIGLGASWFDTGKMVLLLVLGVVLSSCETVDVAEPCECPKHWHDRENDCLPAAEQLPVPETPVYYKSGFN